MIDAQNQKPVTKSDAVAATKVMQALRLGDYAVIGGWGTIFHLLRAIERQGEKGPETGILSSIFAQRTTHDVDIVASTDYVLDMGAKCGEDGALNGELEGGKVKWSVKRFIVSNKEPKKAKVLVADKIEIINQETANRFEIDLYSAKGRGPLMGDAHIPLTDILSHAEEIVIGGQTVRVASVDDLLKAKEGIPAIKKRPQDLTDLDILGRLKNLQRQPTGDTSA